jgi:hypothetical protein
MRKERSFHGKRGQVYPVLGIFSAVRYLVGFRVKGSTIFFSLLKSRDQDSGPAPSGKKRWLSVW